MQELLRWPAAPHGAENDSAALSSDATSTLEHRIDIAEGAALEELIAAFERAFTAQKPAHLEAAAYDRAYQVCTTLVQRLSASVEEEAAGAAAPLQQYEALVRVADQLAQAAALLPRQLVPFGELRRLRAGLQAFVEAQEAERQAARGGMRRAAAPAAGSPGGEPGALQEAGRQAAQELEMLARSTVAALAERTERGDAGSSCYAKAAFVSTMFNFFVRYMLLNQNFPGLAEEVARKVLAQHPATSPLMQTPQLQHWLQQPMGYILPFEEPWVEPARRSDVLHTGTVHVAHLFGVSLCLAILVNRVVAVSSAVLWKTAANRTTLLDQLRYHFADPNIQAVAITGAAVANAAFNYVCALGAGYLWLDPDAAVAQQLQSITTLLFPANGTAWGAEVGTLTAVALTMAGALMINTLIATLIVGGRECVSRTLSCGAKK